MKGFIKVLKKSLEYFLSCVNNREIPGEINGFETIKFRLGMVDIIQNRIKQISC